MNNFCFIVPAFNTSRYVQKCIESIKCQTYKNWRAIIVDDCSTDNTFNIIKSCCNSSKFNILQNAENMKQAYSRYSAYTQTEDEEICIMLDGDDWLFDQNTLSNLDKIYNKYDIDITYGGYLTFENQKLSHNINALHEYPKEVIDQKSYRSYRWIAQHLRTVRSKIIKNIPKQNLIFNGQWLQAATDQAEMFYSLEQSGGRHMNNSFASCVYNVDSSKRFSNSWFNRNKQKSWNEYHNQVLNYITSQQ